MPMFARDKQQHIYGNAPEGWRQEKNGLVPGTNPSLIKKLETRGFDVWLWMGTCFRSYCCFETRIYRSHHSPERACLVVIPPRWIFVIHPTVW